MVKVTLFARETEDQKPMPDLRNGNRRNLRIAWKLEYLVLISLWVGKACHNCAELLFECEAAPRQAAVVEHHAFYMSGYMSGL
jgi:hypothetical protein